MAGLRRKRPHKARPVKPSACPGDNGGLVLSAGFCATVFADNLGHVRQMVVARDGTLYVNTWSGRYFKSPPPPGGFLIALRDTKGSGHADFIDRFGVTSESGGTGGTGIALYGNGVYAEENGRILRYARIAGEVVPSQPPTVVLSGLPLTGDHPMHPFIIDGKGNLYVDSGSATNACQVENRIAGSPGINPCTEKETRGGIWRYDANKTNQVFSPAERYVSGLRNAEGLASMPKAACSRHSTAAINCTRTGPGSTRWHKAPTCRPKSLSSCSPVPIMAGRNATMISSSEGSC